MAKTALPKESDYLDNVDMYLPFSSSIRADHYLKLKRLEHWDRMSVKELLEDALEKYFKGKPHTEQELPQKEVVKLKQLKTALDYAKAQRKQS